MFKNNTNITILIIRLMVGVLMLLHGAPKLISGIPFIESLVTNAGMPKIFAYGVYVGEIIAPIMIIVGYRTKLASLIFAFNCLVAIGLVHPNDIFAMGKHGGWAIELLAMYFFSSLSLIFSGAGKFAISRKHFLD